MIWQRAGLFDYFVMPNPDYLNQLDVVGWLRAGEMAGDFKIAPVYPFMILLLGGLAPGAPPDIYRLPAELLSQAFFLGSIFLLWRLGRGFLGRVGIFLPLLFFLHPQTSGELLGQPLIEEWLLFTVLLGFFFCFKRSRLTAPAVFLACLSRYEGVFLVPALLVRDFTAGEMNHVGGLLRSLARAALSASGLVVWIVLSLVLSGTVNPYVDDILPADSSPWNFPVLAAFSVIRPLVSNRIFIEGEGTTHVALSAGESSGLAIFFLVSVLFWVITAAGAVSLLKKRRSDASGLLLFLVLFTGLHSVYAVPLEKHVYPVLWIVYLFFLAGAGSAAKAVQGKSVTAFYSGAVFLALFGVIITATPEPPPFQGMDRLRITPSVENEPVEALCLHSDPDDAELEYGILKPPFERGDGGLFRADLDGYLAGDILDDGGRSFLKLFEDGIELPGGHSLHADIRDVGEGRFSLWQADDGDTRLNFSTSDNTDPNSNGRIYGVAGRSEFGGSVLLDIGIPGGGEDAGSLRFEAAASGRSPASVRAVLSQGRRVLEERLITMPDSRFSPATFSLNNDALEPGEEQSLTLKLEPIEGSATVDQFSLRIPSRFPYRIFALILCFFCFVAVLYLFSRPSPASQPGTAPGRNLPFAESVGRAILFFSLSFFMAGITTQSVSGWRRFHDHFAFNYGQQYMVGRWYAENAEPGDRLLMSNQHIAGYSSGLDSGYFESNPAPFSGPDPASVLHELQDRGITWLVWDSDEPEPWMEREASLRRFPFSDYGDLVKEVRSGNRIAAVYRIPRGDPPPGNSLGGKSIFNGQGRQDGN